MTEGAEAGRRCGRGRLFADRHRFRGDLHSGPDLLQAFDDDPVRRLEAGVDDPERAHPFRGLHHAHLDGVVRSDDGDAVDPLHLLHRALRHQNRALLELGGRPDPPELTGPDHPVGVREGGFEQDRARRRFHGPVDEHEQAGVGQLAAVGEDEPDRHLRNLGAARLEHLLAPEEREVLLLRQGEADVNRVDARDARQQRAAALAHQRPRIDLGLADEAVRRRRDHGVAELDLGRFDGRLRGVDAGHGRALVGHRGLVLLARDRVLRHQRLEPHDVLAGAGELRFGFGELAAGLGELRLERGAIEGVEALPARDHRTLLELDGLQVAGDAGADLDLGVAARFADRLEIDRNVLLEDGRDLHRGRRGGRRGFGRAAHQHDDETGGDPGGAERSRHRSSFAQVGQASGRSDAGECRSSGRCSSIGPAG